MNCSPLGSFVHGILQARILEWVAFPFSRVYSWPRDWTQISHIAADSLLSEPPGTPHSESSQIIMGIISLFGKHIYPSVENFQYVTVSGKRILDEL